MHWFQLPSGLEGVVAHLAVLAPEWRLRSLCGEPFAIDLVVDVASPGASPCAYEVEAVAYCAGCLGKVAADSLSAEERYGFMGSKKGVSLRDAIVARKELYDALGCLKSAAAAKYAIDDLFRVFGSGGVR